MRTPISNEFAAARHDGWPNDHTDAPGAGCPGNDRTDHTDAPNALRPSRGRRVPVSNAAINDMNALLADAVAAGIQLVARGVIAPKVWLTNIEAADRLGLQPDTLSKMRGHGEGPPWTGTRQLIRYHVDAVDKWMAELPRQERK
jgi:hypothetical protein